MAGAVPGGRIRRGIGAITGLVSVAMLVVGGAAVASPALSARSATPEMTGLGDSYAAGVGAGHYIKSSGDCMRSHNAYAVLDAASIGAHLTFVACSGATVADVEATQLSALTAATQDVTVTVGGNDADFTDVIEQCALPSWAGHCFQAIGKARHIISHALPRRLATLYGDISHAAPTATVVVVGYPRLFDGIDCSPLTWFSKLEMTRLNAAADLIDQTIRTQARAAGFTFVDPRKAFKGHAVCDPDPWIHDLTYPLEESFHPTRAGQAAFAALSVGHL